MSMGLARSVALLAVTLLVGVAPPAAGQRIDVVPTMPPAPVCPASAAIPGPSRWVARFDPKLEVVDTRGRVRYRDGDICRLDVGSGG